MSFKKAELTADIVKRMAYLLDLSFLLIHLYLLWLFNQFHVRPMVLFNIFSVLFYIGLFYAVKKELYRFYVVSMYLEVILHMYLAVYFTGLAGGFHLTLLSITLLLFGAEYVARHLHIDYLPSVPLAVLCMFTYLACILVSHLHEPPYALPGPVAFRMHIFWGIAAFSISIGILHFYVSTSIHSEELLADRLEHDPLTGLPNRYYISDRIKAMETEGALSGCWIAIMDIDNFKRINDTLGHNAGDYVLQTIGSILRAFSRSGNVCRWGGEEFLLLGERGQECLVFLEDLRTEVMNHPFSYEGHDFRITVTIGAARQSDQLSFHEWVGRADDNLYKGKNSGKNRVVL